MDLLEYLAAGVTPHQVVQTTAELLEEEGFRELKLDRPFALERGGRYYVKAFSTSLIAFTIGSRVEENQSFHIAASHTDHPCLHIKPKAELRNGDYMKIDTEVYGGPINNTWMDRPLSIAGIVALKGHDKYSPEIRYVDFKRPVCVVPNLAIHMNRDLNRGTELKAQTDLIPCLGPMKEGQDKDAFFIETLARELDVDSAYILDFDLYVYCCDKPEIVGLNEDMISSPRLDNLTSCYALLEGITSCTRADGINIAAMFDHEEIGSGTKQGADSALLENILKKIYSGLGFSQDALSDAIFGSFLFSVDVAHAVHPSHPEKYDPLNNAPMNSGVMIKLNSNQRYTFDTSAVATAVALCEAAGAKYSKFANHSDVMGGRTLGPMISSHLPMRTVDIGVPMLAMHSARELMGLEDEEHLIKLMKEFYK